MNEALKAIIGNDGTVHVNYRDFEKDRALFVIGYDGETPVCCAGLVPFDVNTAEVKRVFARRNRIGAGAQLMEELERLAKESGFEKLILECRTGNPHALEFYRKTGYAVRSKYPPYEKEEDAVCMEKSV